MLILKDLILPETADQRLLYTGIDSATYCIDLAHFNEYPFTVSYEYNSRGFRDREWPGNIDDLANAVWCLGDSFTVGLGVPWAHTWPQQLERTSPVVTINVSMDGASNDWLARTAIKIFEAIGPVRMAIMWSFLHRRELQDSRSHWHRILRRWSKMRLEWSSSSTTGQKETQSDHDRRLWHDRRAIDPAQDFENFQQNFHRVQGRSQICHMLIPWAYYGGHRYRELWQQIREPDWPQLPPNDLVDLPGWVQNKCVELGVWAELTEYQPDLADQMDSFMQQNRIHQISSLDLARDGLHFDIKTAQHVADLVHQDLIEP